MKYPPEHFIETDQANLLELIGCFPLATCIGLYEGNVLTAQLPFAISDNKSMALIGHIARDNALAHMLERQGASLQLIFNGPQSYISPAIFPKGQVPTWNYAAVNLKGSYQLIDDPEQLMHLLNDQFKVFERDAHQYKTDLYQWGNLTPYILGIKFSVKEAIGHFKLSQNKPENLRVLALQETKERHINVIKQWWESHGL